MTYGKVDKKQIKKTLRANNVKETNFFSYGNWCGPGWTAGQNKPASALTNSDRKVPAIDKLDQACKNHDIGLHDAKTSNEVALVNEQFTNEAWSEGFTGKAMSAMVQFGGPSEPTLKRKRINHHFPISKKANTMGLGSYDDEHRRPQPDTIPPAGNSDNVEPASNLVTRAANTTTGRVDGSETGLDPTNYWRLRPYDDCMNVIMPWYRTGYLDIATGANGQAAMAFRLNSIYDIATVHAYSNVDATPQADTTDGTVELAQLYGYWLTLYRYWTVVKSEYTMRIWIEETPSAEISIWTYHNGQQQPPLVATSGAVVTDMARATHQHCHKSTLRNDPTEAGKSFYDKGIRISGYYHQGNHTVHNDVAEDAFKEIWHRQGVIPPLREVVTFIANKSDMQRNVAPAITCKLRYEIKFKYYVQLKDLKTDYQYPTQETDWSGVADPFNMTS